MNREATKTEINNIVNQYQAGIRYTRQHAVSKKYMTQLEELGILDLMPAKFGNGDAQAVIAAAMDNGKMVGSFNQAGEGDVIRTDASELYKLLNEIEHAPEAPKTIKRGSKVRVLPHTFYQHLSNGAVISPAIEHTENGYETTIRAVWQDDMEDENGNIIIEYTYEDATGAQYSADQLEII